MEASAEQRVAAIASRQFGLVTWAQCDQSGMSDHWVRARVKRRTWRRLGRGVYSLSPGPLTVEQRAMAALLLGGDQSVLSHHSAAVWHRISVPSSAAVHLLVPMGARPAPAPGIRHWRTRDLEPADVLKHGAVRLTKVGRTLLDLSWVLDEAQLRVALDSALRLRRSNLNWIKLLVERKGQGRRGARRLRELLSEYTLDDEVCDSDLESFSMELGLATGRTPHLHYRVESEGRFEAEVDLAWPRVRLGVELDSWKFHSDRRAFQNDRSRDRRLAIAGWQVLRYTWADVRERPDRFISEISNVYEMRFEK